MTRLGRPLPWIGPALAILLGAVPASAQDTTVTVLDSVPPAEVPVPVAADSILPVQEPYATVGPLPLHNRVSFSREGILWSGAHTLSDLLAAIPGVYVARAGFLGQPEYVAYAGRGGGAIELYWDGLPLVPLGPDSSFIDPSRIPLSYLDRVDVEVLPSSLRVYLVSTRHRRLEPRSMIQVTSGDFDTSVFAGLFQKRWSGGLGINLAADYTGTDGASGPNRNDQSFDTWARVDWLPNPSSGASYQVRRQRHERDPATGVPERNGSRTDFLFSLFTVSRPNGLGLRAEAGLGASSWTGDSLTGDQRIRQAYANLRYRRSNLTLQVGGSLADARVTASADARFGWVPLPGIVLSGGAGWQQHERDRRSLRAHGTLGLFGGPFSAAGTIEFRDGLQAPALLSDSAQRTVDLSARLGFRTLPLSGHVAVVRREAYAPLPFPGLAGVARFDPSGAATYVVADVTLRSSRALALHGWYSTPLEGAAADLQPPKHARVDVTFRSRFLRTFRSGAFDLVVRIGMESWSTGPGGFDGAGERLVLQGATFYDALVQFRIVDFTAFWLFRNGYNSPDPYVPGYVYPLAVQTFGVKWEFAN